MKMLIDELIPYVDANLKTVAKQSHRAMAGLSMGGMETHTITLNKPDVFAYYALLRRNLYSGRAHAVSYISENTAHEFQTWRRSLYQLAPLLFK